MDRWGVGRLPAPPAAHLRLIWDLHLPFSIRQSKMGIVWRCRKPGGFDGFGVEVIMAKRRKRRAINRENRQTFGVCSKEPLRCKGEKCPYASTCLVFRDGMTPAVFHCWLDLVLTTRPLRPETDSSQLVPAN